MNLQDIKEFYQSKNLFNRGWLSILKNTLETFSNSRASQAAASLAYYAIFSLFPLLIVLIAASSFFLNSQQVYQSITRLVQDTFPTAPKLIIENLKQVLDARGPVGIVGLLTLLWSASGFFTNLAYNVNRAWPGATPRSFIKKRLVGLGMIAQLGALLILSLVLDSFTQLAGIFNLDTIPFLHYVPWGLFSSVGSWLIVFLLYLQLYRWVPSVKVGWKATLWGALITSIGWKIATAGYTWYLSAGLGRYQLIYGSLGAIIALLFLIYLLSIITLFGAHLTAAVDLQEKEKSQTGFERNI